MIKRLQAIEATDRKVLLPELLRQWGLELRDPLSHRVLMELTEDSWGSIGFPNLWGTT